MSNPLDGYGSEEAALARAVEAFFRSASASAPAGRVYAAVKLGIADPVFGTKEWEEAVKRLVIQIKKVELSTFTGGLASGKAAIPTRVPSLGAARLAELAELHAGQRAVEMIQAIDEVTREGIKRLIATAAASYVTDQSASTLRRLQEEIRASIGLTPKQAARIERWRSIAVASGMPPSSVSAGVVARAAAARDLRARAIAERGVIESVSFARHQAWLEAQDAGDLSPKAMKRWMTQGDDRVRASHRAQSRQGPIPLREIYPIQQVQHPPSKEPGCRCWEVLLPEGDGSDFLFPTPPPAPDPALPPPLAQAPAAPEAPRVRSTRLLAELQGLSAELAPARAVFKGEIAAAEAAAKTAYAQLYVERAEFDRLVFTERISRNHSRVLEVQRRIEALQIDAIRKAETEARKRLLEFDALARSRAKAMIKLDTPPAFAPDVVFKTTVKDRKTKMAEAIEWLQSVTSRSVLPAHDTITVFAAPGQRSYALGRGIFMTKSADVGTYIHEIGHWFERDPAVLARSVAYLEERTRGELAVPLRKLQPRHGYRTGEVARKDKWTNPYTGKIYKSFGVFEATEILSMGLEALFRDPLEFARQDPEFLEFVLAFLSGD